MKSSTQGAGNGHNLSTQDNNHSELMMKGNTMTEKQLEKLLEAEEILITLYNEIRDTKGMKREAKRLDTILSKIYNLYNLHKN